MVKIINGGTPPSGDERYWNGTIPFVTPPDLNSLDGGVIKGTARSITNEAVSFSGLAPARSVLLSTRAPIGHVGRTRQPSAFNQGCRALVPGPETDSRFLAYAVVSVRDEMSARGQGTTFTELSSSALAEVPIPNPPLKVQEEIANFLDREMAAIGALIAKTEELVALLDERIAARIDREVFGWQVAEPDCREVPAFVDNYAALRTFIRGMPSDWAIGRFKELLQRRVERNSDGSAVMKSLKTTGAVVDRFSKQEPDEASVPRYLLVHPNDLVVNPMWLVGGSIGVSGEAGAVSPDYRVFRSRGSIEPRFLHHVLRSRPYRDQYELFTRADTTFDRRVQQPSLDSLPLPVPEWDVQLSIARQLDEAVIESNVAVATARQSVALARERRAAIIAAAVTGDLNVGITA